MRTILTLLVGCALTLSGWVSAQTERDEEPEPRVLHDPAEALPSRATGEAVLSGREAFESGPQIRIGERDRSDPAAEAAAAGAQLTGSEQTLKHECAIGERVELVGDRNIVDISGHCIGLSITGDGNQVTIAVVDEIRIEGADNDVRWQRGFTVERPSAHETGGRNSVAARRDDDG